MIKDLKPDQTIEGTIFLVGKVLKSVSNKGIPYYNLTLQDKSGQMNARKWEINPGDEDIFAVGRFVKVSGELITYNAALQLKITKAEPVAEETLDISNYVIFAPIPRAKLQQELLKTVAEIKNPEIKRLIEALLKDNLVSFSLYPAATTNHHEFASGLLYHTVGMLRCARALSELYPTLNKDVLTAGVIIHDMGKIFELSGPVVPRYTTAGQLIGHISLMHAKLSAKCDELRVDPEVKVVLEHLLLASHGEKEFGSPIPPMIKEAEVLSAIDNLDARINMIDKAIAKIEPGEFTPQKIAALEGRRFYKPKL